MLKKIFPYVSLLTIILAGFFLITKPPQPPSSEIISATITPMPTPSPIQRFDRLLIEDIRPGTGSAVKIGDKIVINYKGTLTNGTKFDSSYDRGIPYETPIGVGRVIEGWDQGVIGMKVGGLRKLYIPSSMAYGERGAGNLIPPDSDLIFELELLEIK